MTQTMLSTYGEFIRRLRCLGLVVLLWGLAIAPAAAQYRAAISQAVIDAVIAVKTIGNAESEGRGASVSDAQLRETAALLNRVTTSPQLFSLPQDLMGRVREAISAAARDGLVVNSPGLHYTEHDGIVKLVFERFPTEEAVAFVKDFSAINSLATALGTDFLGLVNSYLDLINDRYEDPAIFRRNLKLMLHKGGDYAIDENQPCRRSDICHLQVMSVSFEDLGFGAVALEFQRILLSELKRIPSIPAAYRQKARVRLAELEARDGELSQARRLLDQIEEGGVSGDPQVRRRVSRLRGELAPRSGSRASSGSLDQAAGELIAALVKKPEWGDSPGWTYPDVARAMRQARRGALTRTTSRRLQRRLDTWAGPLKRIRACRKGRNVAETLREVALLSQFTQDHAAFCAFLFDRNVKRKFRRGMAILRADWDSHYEFGVTVPFFNKLAGVAEAMDLLGYRIAARTTRSIGVQLLRGNFEERESQRKSSFGLSSDVISMLAGEATEQAKAGKVAQATLLLNDAMFDVVGRYEQAWSGGAGSLDAIARDMRGPLRRLTQGWQVLLDGRSGRGPAVVDGAYRAAQLASLNDTATAVAAGLRRSALLDTGTAEAIGRGEVRVWTARHIARLRQTAEFRFDYGLTKAEKQAQALLVQSEQELGRSVSGIGPFDSVRPLSLRETTSLLADGDTLVFIVPTAKGCEVFVVARERQRWRACSLDQKTLRSLVGELRKGLDPTAVSLLDQRSFPLSASHKLYKGVFGSILDQLGSNATLKVVVQGPLASLPLSVLTTKPPQRGQSYADAAWLVRRFAISHLVQVGDLRLVAEQRAQKVASVERTMIGFANPKFDNAGRGDRSVSGSAASDNRGALSSSLAFRGRNTDLSAIGPITPLPETADELTAVAASYSPGSSEILLAGAARETAIKALSKNGQLEQAKLLYFATHAVLPAELDGANEAGLLLTIPGRPSDEDDGLLSAAEISLLRLNADFVVLSACNTAGGRIGSDAAYSGLAKSFLEAGARSVMVSHWLVVSDAAVEIMTGMFADLAARPGKSQAQALRDTLIGLLEGQTPRPSHHPAYWAPFVLIGAAG